MAVTQQTKPQPVLIIMSTLAGLQVLTGGAILSDVIGVKAAGLAILVVASIQAGMGFFLRGLVTPNQDVGAYLDSDREMVSGPASGLEAKPAVVLARAPHGP